MNKQTQAARDDARCAYFAAREAYNDALEAYYAADNASALAASRSADNARDAYNDALDAYNALDADDDDDEVVKV